MQSYHVESTSITVVGMPQLLFNNYIVFFSYDLIIYLNVIV